MVKRNKKTKKVGSSKVLTSINSGKITGKKINTLKKTTYVPILVKVISLLFYIGAFFAILFGIILLIGGIVGDSVIDALKINGVIDSAQYGGTESYIFPIILASLLVSGVLAILIGVLYILIGRGLWKGRQWARIVTIVLMLLGFISSLINGDFVTLIITGLILAYLIVDKRVRSAFSGK